MSNLKYRVLVIVALVAASVWALFPRTVVERVSRGGSFVYDTVQRVPLKRGLDLQGGMHLALEIDETAGTVTNKLEAIEQAETVIRNRIDEFGVAEPVVQRIGDERIIVELPGIDDPVRAEEVVKKAAFLEFQITDESNALARVVPRLDQIVRERNLAAASPSAAGDTALRPGLRGLLNAGGDSAAPGDTAARDTAATDSAGADSGAAAPAGDTAGPAAPGNGLFARTLQPDPQMPGR